MIDIHSLQSNPENARTIKTAGFKSLKQKIKDFPEMLAKRPVVYDSSQGNIILGGNRRHDAILALLKEKAIEVKDEYYSDAATWTPEQKRKFIVIDNVSDGEWDYDKLSEQFEAPELEEMGLNVLGTPETKTKTGEVNTQDLTKDLNIECPRCHFEFEYKKDA